MIAVTGLEIMLDWSLVREMGPTGPWREHTGGSGSLAVWESTSLSPRVLGFQVGDSIPEVRNWIVDEHWIAVSAIDEARGDRNSYILVDEWISNTRAMILVKPGWRSTSP